MKIFFKKAMSLFLSVVMLVSLTAGLYFSAFANTTEASNENTEAVWTSISFTPASPYEIIKNTNGWNDSGGTFHYYLPSLRNGDILTLTDDSGNSVSYTLNSNGWCFIADGFPSISIDEISMYDEQNGNWSIGGENYFVIEYSGMTTQVPVTIIEDPVDYYEYVVVEPYEIIEKTNGYMDNDVWYYYTPEINNGDQIIIHYTDGSTETYTREDYRFINQDGNELSCYYNGFSFDGLGETTFEVRIENVETPLKVPVTIIEDPVDYCELVPIKPYELFENTNGYENGDTWYYYAPSFQNGDRIIIHFNDGTSTKYIYNNFDFLNENGETLSIYRYGFDFSGLGETTFEVRVDKYGKTINVPVTIIENPIESFTFNPIKPLEIVERTHGYEYKDGVWEYNEIYFNKGDTIEINYTDGTTDTFVNQYSGWGSYSFENSNGERLSVYYSSFVFSGLGETETTIGLHNYSMSVSVPVTIIEDPVESCEFVPAKPYEIMENTNGFYDGEDGWYYWGPNFNDGDQFIVHLKNGSNEIYTFKDYEFKNENDDSIYIRSESFRFDTTGETTFEIIVDDYGKNISVPVTIIENPVASIAFNPVSPFTCYMNANGNETEDGYRYRPPYFRNGDEIVVNFKNGTTESYVFNVDRWDFISDTGKTIDTRVEEFVFNGTGETTFEMNIPFYGMKVNVPVTIIENPVDFCEFVPIKEYKIVEKTYGTDFNNSKKWCYYAPSFNVGDKLIVHLKDGTFETYTYSDWRFVNKNGDELSCTTNSFYY